MRELFVWYRVSAKRATETRAAVTAMHDALRAGTDGLVARLLVRRDDDTPQQTWMETYARPTRPAGVDADLEARIASAARHLGDHIEGDRHVEAFEA